jgi:hypothetical protein
MTDAGVPIHVSLTANDTDVLIGGRCDSVLVPVHGLDTDPVETGYVAEQIRADTTLRRRDQIPPGLAQLEEGHHIVVNGLKYEVVDIHEGVGEHQMTLKPA